MIELADRRYMSDYVGMREIPVSGEVFRNTHILKAYLGETPGMPHFGQIVAVFTHGTDTYALYFHVWKPHQPASMANRPTEIHRLTIRTAWQCHELLELTDTGFGSMAFWTPTPDSALKDEASLAVRAVMTRLKNYSIKNQLCRNFRRKYGRRCDA